MYNLLLTATGELIGVDREGKNGETLLASGMSRPQVRHLQQTILDWIRSVKLELRDGWLSSSDILGEPQIYYGAEVGLLIPDGQFVTTVYNVILRRPTAKGQFYNIFRMEHERALDDDTPADTVVVLRSPNADDTENLHVLVMKLTPHEKERRLRMIEAKAVASALEQAAGSPAVLFIARQAGDESDMENNTHD